MKFSMKFFFENFPDFENFDKKNDFFSTLIFFRLGYSFDAEICPLSMYGVFSAIPALYPCQLAKI